MAVYTKITENDLEKLLKAYEIGVLEKLVPIAAGVQNSNYFLYTSNAKYVLTIYEDSESYDDLPFFLSVMSHLSKKNIPCPLPVPAKNGDYLHVISGKPCAIVTFVKGHEVDIITDKHISNLGGTLANMHLGVQDFSEKRPNQLSISGWDKIFNAVKGRMDEFELGIVDEIAEKLAFLKKNWPSNLPLGVIHSDLFPDNILFSDDIEIAGIIDFYFACDDAYAYDLAICLNAWCFEKDYSFNKDKAKILLNSYNQMRKLSPQENEALPILACGAAMRFFLSRMYDWVYRVEDAMVTPKTPLEYLQKLRFHFEAKEAIYQL